MQTKLNIIPSPQHTEFTRGEIIDLTKVYIDLKKEKVILSAIDILSKETDVKMAQKEEATVIVTDDLTCLSKEDLNTFENRFAPEQGYVIKKEETGPVIVYAKSALGAAYGVISLSQIAGKDIKTLTVRDWPDFVKRGIKWQIWAECCIWSYDFGDGIEAFKERIIRKLDNCFKYKINLVNAEGFGFDAERFEGYADLMRFMCDRARERGIHLGCGGYTMGYGMLGHNGAYQGKGYKNRKRYPDGEIYECMGTHTAYRFINHKKVDRSVYLTEVEAREWGTCLSNDALFEEKMRELDEYIRKTHIGGVFFHNQDSHEIHPEIWLARCENCRKKWPNDDIFALDGMAGAFAYFIRKLADRLQSIKDGDYDASRDLFIRMISPGYLYAEMTSDEDFDTGVKFWGKVSEYISDVKNVYIGFREEFFYHSKPERRTAQIEKLVKNAAMENFIGCDGFYDDKLFAPTASLNYIMKGAATISTEAGNAFQEPLAVFIAEYSWNSEKSNFYNVSPRPENYEEFLNVFYGMLESRVYPDEIYKSGGFLDIICTKLYGEKIGADMAKLFKLHGKNGEPPIPCACNVDIYTNFTRVIYPMRWDNDGFADINGNGLDTKEIKDMTVRFEQCSIVTKKAHEIIKDVLKKCDNKDIKNDLTWLEDCFNMGQMLTECLFKYMTIYGKILPWFTDKTVDITGAEDEIYALREEIKQYLDWVEASERKPFDRFGGSLVRRYEIGEHLDYWTRIMLSSLKTGKRIPDDVRPLATRQWW